MGYDEKSPINPKTAIWNFGKVNKNGQIVKSSLYAFTSHKQKDSGIVLIDGSIKIAENQKLLPDIFKYYQKPPAKLPLFRYAKPKRRG